MFGILTHQFMSNLISTSTRHRFVAGAACPSEIVNFMDSIGIPVCEGYGKSRLCILLSIDVNTSYAQI